MAMSLANVALLFAIRNLFLGKNNTRMLARQYTILGSPSDEGDRDNNLSIRLVHRRGPDPGTRVSCIRRRLPGRGSQAARRAVSGQSLPVYHHPRRRWTFHCGAVVRLIAAQWCGDRAPARLPQLPCLPAQQKVIESTCAGRAAKRIR